MAIKPVMRDYKSTRYEFNVRKDPTFIGRHTNAFADEDAYTWQIEVFKYDAQYMIEDSRVFLWSWTDRASLVWW
jgi:hypothetical protein